MRNRKNLPSNKNAIIQTRWDRTGKLRTETARRDEGATLVAASTNKNDGTRLYIDTPEFVVALNGREARTVYRVLSEHFAAAGKTLY